jgi:hypothetical protein
MKKIKFDTNTDIGDKLCCLRGIYKNENGKTLKILCSMTEVTLVIED